MNWEYFMVQPDEKPLDRLVENGGFCSIFRTIGCVGDSLSSGEFEATNEKGDTVYADMFEYSWGQFLGRACGSKVYNFSRGGMSAKEYVESFAEANDFWNKDKACQAYIFALGVNDLYNFGQDVGTISDICAEDYTQNAKTFVGYYAQIVQRLKEIQPKAKFFFMTMPREEKDERIQRLGAAHREALYAMAQYFDNAYVIDLWQYAPVFTNEIKKSFFLGGHMAACGYAVMAKFVGSYIDYIIRANLKDFKQVAFIGTGLEKKE
jgi:lysophospholipase L1-like esterase